MMSHVFQVLEVHGAYSKYCAIHPELVHFLCDVAYSPCRMLYPYCRHAFNDVVVLNVHRSRGMFTSNGNSVRGAGAEPPSSSGRAHPARRRRYSSDSDSDSDSDGEQAESTATSGSRHGYTYTWVHPMVRGTPPVGRLAHSSAVVRLLEDGEAGSGSGQQAYMVVFGGVGTGQVFNDVSALRWVNTCEWAGWVVWCSRTSTNAKVPPLSHVNALSA